MSTINRRTLVCRSRVAARPEFHCQEGNVRLRQCLQIDDAAAEFARVIRRERFLHGCASKNVRREQIQRNLAPQRIRARQRCSIQQRGRIAITETTNIDITARRHGQTREAHQRLRRVGIAGAIKIFHGKEVRDRGRFLLRLWNVSSENNDYVPVFRRLGWRLFLGSRNGWRNEEGR